MKFDLTNQTWLLGIGRFRISCWFTFCDMMSQSSDINWRPSCLVADSASDTLTRAQHASFFAAHWFGWWILLDVHLTSLYVCCYWQPAQRRRRRRRRGSTVASWDRNLTSLFFPPCFFFLVSQRSHAFAAVHRHMQPQSCTLCQIKDS